jgi:hypothetical protein
VSLWFCFCEGDYYRAKGVRGKGNMVQQGSGERFSRELEGSIFIELVDLCKGFAFFSEGTGKPLQSFGSLHGNIT